MSRRREPTEALLDILAVNDEGLGLARWQQKNVFVRNALPGEQVAARIVKRKKGNRYADGVHLASAAHSARQASACPHFPRCGGCALHHLDYPQQLGLKQQKLAEALAANHVRPGRWRPPTSAGQLGYRRKARLGVRQVGDSVLVGFRESFSNRVARLDACLTLTPQLSRLIPELRQLVGAMSMPSRIPQIEVAQGDDSIVLMLRHLEPLSDADRTLLQAFSRQHGITLLSQSGGYDSLCNLDGSAVPRLSYQLPGHGLHLQFAPQQFTQVNARMNERLIDVAVAYLGDLRDRTVIDLFCGIGNFALPMARKGAFVYGFEGDAGAIAMAQHNAQHNGLDAQTRFASTDLYHPCELPQAHAVVLDPPRSGAGPHLGSWLNQQAQLDDIVYVSCNPVSFAADAHTICASGYHLEEVGIYDMFPHTAHIETVGVFRRTAAEQTRG